MPNHTIIAVRPPGNLTVPQVSRAPSGDHPGALASAIRLLGHHFSEHASANPAFVLRADWGEVYANAIAKGIATGRHRLTLAIPDGCGTDDPVAVCACWLRAGIIGESTVGVISELFVLPECRGQGVGRKLAEDACHWLLGNGASELTLTTPVLGGAKSFWERLGFAVTSLGMTRFPPK
jgi:GNAT superfamily N-acetyltransferase